MSVEAPSSTDILLKDESVIVKPLSVVEPENFDFTRKAYPLPMGHPDDPSVPAALKVGPNSHHPHAMENDDQAWYRILKTSDALNYDPTLPPQQEGIKPSFKKAILAVSSAMRLAPGILGGNVRDQLVTLIQSKRHPVYLADNAASGLINAMHYVNEIYKISITSSEHSYAKVLEVLDKIDQMVDDSRPSEKDYSQIVRKYPIAGKVLDHLTDPNLNWTLRDLDQPNPKNRKPLDPETYFRMRVRRVEEGLAVPELGIPAGLPPNIREQTIEQMWMGNSAYNSLGLKAYCGRTEMEIVGGNKEFKYYGSKERPNTKNPWPKTYEPQGGAMYLADYIVDVAQKFSQKYPRLAVIVEQRLRNLDLGNRPFGWRVMERLTARRRGKAKEKKDSTGVVNSMNNPSATFSAELIQLTDKFDNDPTSPNFNLEGNDEEGTGVEQYKKDVNGVDAFKSQKKAALVGKGIVTSITDPSKGLMESLGAMVALYKATAQPEKTKRIREENMPQVLRTLADIWSATNQAPKIEEVAILFQTLEGPEYGLEIDGPTKSYVGAQAGRAHHKRELVTNPDPKGGSAEDVIKKAFSTFVKAAGG